MAGPITDYATLKTAILDFSHKSNLTPYLDLFIQDAQEQINTDILKENEGNGVRPMEKALASVAIDGSGLVAVPADYMSMKSLQLTLSGSRVCALQQKSADWIYDRYPRRTSDGPPSYFAREAASFIFGPFPNSGYNVQGTYYQLAPLLTAGNQATHWMVLKAPLMFHAACMLSAMKFLKDSEAITVWAGTYQTKLEAMITADKAERWNASGLQMELG